MPASSHTIDTRHRGGGGHGDGQPRGRTGETPGPLGAYTVLPHPSLRISRAALYPQAPITPPPGWVAAPHM